MPAAVVPAAFEHVEEAGQVGVDIGVRIDQRMAHAGLRGEMHDTGEADAPRTAPPCRSRSARSSLTKAKAGQLREFGEPRLLERRIVIGIEVVDADDRPARLRAAGARRGSR